MNFFHNPNPVTHELKSWPLFFNETEDGVRSHELRRNDRDFKQGDYLLMREYNPITLEYTGRSHMVQITLITENTHNPCAESPKGLNDGYCVLSIQRVV